MPPNPERRAQLTDAGIRILAREGARGLTHRAVDAEAGVPIGTASNYFKNRDALMEDLGRRILQILSPPDDLLVEMREMEAPTRDQQVRLIREVVRNVLAHSGLFLALLELRLEATRRPRLRATLTEAVRRTVESDVAFHEASGLPGCCCTSPSTASSWTSSPFRTPWTSATWSRSWDASWTGWSFPPRPERRARRPSRRRSARAMSSAMRCDARTPENAPCMSGSPLG